MGSGNFISAAVLDISRKATAVKERADFIIGRLHSCTQNPRPSLQLQALLQIMYISCTVDISAAVLDISRKATAVKERADFIGKQHSCTQNPRLSSCKLYFK